MVDGGTRVASQPLAGEGPPVPFAPRVSVRAAYGSHRIVQRNRFWQAVAKATESVGPVYRGFTGAEERAKRRLFGCRMCGQCALPVTGYACPMTCPKQLRNGPCGGVQPDGGCEVYPDRRCVWVMAYERAEQGGHGDDLSLLQRPLDQRRFGESSWVNYWSGRDEMLAARPSAGEPVDIRVGPARAGRT